VLPAPCSPLPAESPAVFDRFIEHVINWVNGIGPWAYLAIFVVVSLESAAFLGFFLPSEALVFFGGFLASPAGHGVLDLKFLIPLVAVAAVLGDSVGYELGRLLKKEWFLRYGRWASLREPQWQRLEDFFQRHGGKTVFFARFSAFFRILVPFFAGAARLRYLHFLKWNIAGGVVWATGSVLIGYFAGKSWELVEHWIGRGALIIAAAVIVVLLAIRYGRQTKRKPHTNAQSSPTHEE
jgi:membrane protein DedA with SNARE-associated domain